MIYDQLLWETTGCDVTAEHLMVQLALFSSDSDVTRPVAASENYALFN